MSNPLPDKLKVYEGLGIREVWVWRRRLGKAYRAALRQHA